jgi:glutathione synthase/RimK-type ligase-like ATP-grasp enzyme
MPPDQAATLIIVTDREDWPVHLRDVAVVTARDYLSDRAHAGRRGVRIVNLCRSYRYQKAGYYVSLLGHARGHRPMPSLAAIQDVKSPTVIRLVSDELEELTAAELAGFTGVEVVLDVYFGVEANGRFPALAKALFGRLPLPLMRAVFTRNERTERWALTSCNPTPLPSVLAEHSAMLTSALESFLRRRTKVRRPDVGRYDLAILADPREEEPPSDAGALRRFAAAGEAEGFAVEFIDREDYARIAEFDALFIRETTAVNHRTFRFAQRAAKEGLVVIDDPSSILRCTNKVFLAEVLERAGIPGPTTVVAHRGNLDTVLETIGLPCVLKQPDSSFSQGVVKVEDVEGFRAETRRLLRRSDLIVAQAFMPSRFDWRIGVLSREPIYACKYYMARRHWQIVRRDGENAEEGPVDAVALDAVPAPIMEAALAAAGLMGDGLYGVDLKEEEDGRAYVIEVNDNPSIDAGYEDALLGMGLYRRIMSDFRRRLDDRGRSKGAR